MASPSLSPGLQDAINQSINVMHSGAYCIDSMDNKILTDNPTKQHTICPLLGRFAQGRMFEPSSCSQSGRKSHNMKGGTPRISPQAEGYTRETRERAKAPLPPTPTSASNGEHAVSHGTVT
ncbi:hypothetical protein E2C01_020722 [Portunus trituberculatus]|uniref:Uncharacterized protein n=1 Tax=Portunus trituberculatus TaxID=210409 RepID=A0A5B7E1C0_PORTR|nr:hypothetical protein [Portunus trituberculatus]